MLDAATAPTYETVVTERDKARREICEIRRAQWDDPNSHRWTLRQVAVHLYGKQVAGLLYPRSA